MSTKEPWLDKWKITRKLSGGGQGTTFIVESVTGSRSGVLKTLRHQENKEARGRMYREVACLKVLHSTGCRIPQVLDSNTEQFEDVKVPLFFVMEFMPGETLAAYVSKAKGLPLKEAAAIVLKLCETIRIGQKEAILHRDLKPENIVIRPASTGDAGLLEQDVVIVDYGLSFNRNEEESLTRRSETLDNKFLSLPERRVPGGNRRDSRSDVTGLCGILYYCITGEPPVDLVDADGNPPHMRRGHSIRERLGDGATTGHLEALFSRGFAVNIEYRLQSVEELVSRLKEAMDPLARVPKEDLSLVAKRSAEALMAHDRKSQLAEYTRNAQVVVKSLKVQAEVINSKIKPFVMRVVPAQAGHKEGLEGYEEIDSSVIMRLFDMNNANFVDVGYRVMVSGSQCAVLRCLFRGCETRGLFAAIVPGVKVGEWECVMRFEGTKEPECGMVTPDLEAIVAEAIGILERDILEAGEGKK